MFGGRKRVASLLGVITWGVYSSSAWHILEHLGLGVEMHVVFGGNCTNCTLGHQYNDGRLLVQTSGSMVVLLFQLDIKCPLPVLHNTRCHPDPFIKPSVSRKFHYITVLKPLSLVAWRITKSYSIPLVVKPQRICFGFYLQNFQPDYLSLFKHRVVHDGAWKINSVSLLFAVPFGSCSVVTQESLATQSASFFTNITACTTYFIKHSFIFHSENF
jgi:hypothetical protein